MIAGNLDVAPFGLPLPEGNGIMWEDPREIHRVVVHFESNAPSAGQIKLEYWGSWWPERHLPKDREPGGGEIGWLELGNWHKYGWRTADAEAQTDGSTVTFAFRPVSASEFPKLKDYPAAFRYTLKLRITSDQTLPRITRLQTFTDSVLEQRCIRLVGSKATDQYGYTLDDFERHWFGRGGMSMQACLLLDVEPYLYRDDVKHALRAAFNAMAVSYFPDVRMNTEHALPNMDDWRGDHFKSSDESNAAGWLRYLFVREEGEELLLGQAVPRDRLKPGESCGIERAATYFGPTTLTYESRQNEIIAHVAAPRRNPPRDLRLRFRAPQSLPLASVTVNGQAWKNFDGEWVWLPGDVGTATVVARYSKP